jgi:hypothetical protein
MRSAAFTVLIALLFCTMIAGMVTFYFWWRMPALRDVWERWRSGR